MHRRRNGSINGSAYSEKEATIELLDSVEFNSALPSNITDYSINSLPRALNVSLERKRAKIERFLRQHGQRDLHNHLPQLRSFAQSPGGLIRDEFRERIWPVLAQYLLPAPRLKQLEKDTLSSSEGMVNGDGEEDDDDEAGNDRISSVSDSDFESAVSTFSGYWDDQEGEWEGEEVDYPETKGHARAKVLSSSEREDPSLDELRSHREWNQVELDVNRTLARFPPNIEEAERESLQRDLTPMIVRLLWYHPDFSYYQGFHDVCLTLMLALGVQKAVKVAKLLTKRGAFYNYLTASLEESALGELHFIYVLLYFQDPEVERHMRLAELGTLFAISWPLTWFSHSLQNYSQIVTLFDLFLASHPLMPIYVGAALIVERREELLACEQPDMPTLHHLLGTIPPSINLNRVIEMATSMLAQFPPALVTGEHSRREYSAMCVRQRRQQIAFAKLHQHIAAPRPNTLPRNNLNAISPWLVAGTAAGVALYLYIQRLQLM